MDATILSEDVRTVKATARDNHLLIGYWFWLRQCWKARGGLLCLSFPSGLVTASKSRQTIHRCHGDDDGRLAALLWRYAIHPNPIPVCRLGANAASDGWG